MKQKNLIVLHREPPREQGMFMDKQRPSEPTQRVESSWAKGVADDLFWALRRREPPFQAGRRFGLSLPRRFVGDLLHFARKVPSIPMQRRMQLADLVAARADHRLAGWCAVFTKAYAIVSATRPELRRCHLSFPWCQLYEHPFVVASVAFERDYRGEPGVFLGLIPSPQQLRLAEVEALVRYYKTTPVDQVGRFRLTLNLSRLPLPLRRLVWWFGLNARGLYRASFFGTFGVSTVSSLGSSSLHQLSPLTTTLNYGTFAEDGSIDVRLTYDHRVMDGAVVARALAHLEDVLHGEILTEMREGRLVTARAS